MERPSVTVPEAAAARSGAARLFSGEEIAAAIAAMAGEMAPRLAGRNPVVLAVMHGGVFTAVELCRHFEFPYEFDYVHPTRYAGALEGGALQWRVRPDAALSGRTVLVVDDILDRGVTLQAVNDELERIGVEAQYNAVLIVKQLDNDEPRPRVHAAGLTVGDVYVFGSGMDYRGYWRGLAGLYTFQPPRRGGPT